MTIIHIPQCVTAIHKAQRLFESGQISSDRKRQLAKLIDSVLSFTAYYLRWERAEARPEQHQLLTELETIIKDIENESNRESAVDTVR